MVKIKIGSKEDVWVSRCLAVTKLIVAITTLIVTIILAIKK